MSNSFWNIHLIVSRFLGDEIQPIWSKCVKFHENQTKTLETTAFLRKCIEIIFNKAFFPDFAHYGHLALTKLIDARKNMIFLLILIEFIISESFNAILKFGKIHPLGGAWVARSLPRGGASSPPSGGEFFQIS